MVKNIIWISNGSTLNGAERCLVESASCLKNNKLINSKILLPDEGPLTPELQNKGLKDIEVVSLPWWIDRGNTLSTKDQIILFCAILKSVVKLLFIIGKSKPDLVVTNTIACPSGAIAAYILRRKHIWYIHEFGKEDHGFNFIFGDKLSYFLIDKFSKIIILNSKSVYNKYCKFIDNKKLEILYSEVRIPIETITEYNKNNEQFKIIIAGRLSPSKGQLEAVKAINILHKKYNLSSIKISLIILGSLGSKVYHDEIQNLILEYSLKDHVKFIPFCSNPFNIISASNILLMCSKNEAFGRITVEALKLGVPVIGAKIGGTLEIIRDNENGLLYESGDYKQLASKIYELYNNETLYKILSENASKVANKFFSNEKHTNDLMEILHKL